MRIQNNITAMNTHRMYTINNDNVAKSAEKLSSGYRINRAGDDAAGLAISEKMRSQIRGLNMAAKNSQDAISLVQTAEGALQETHSMLQRMNELAVQSATGTNESIDRDALAKEYQQLKREINDIAEQTTFNNMKVLDGSLSYNGPIRSASTAGVNATVQKDAVGSAAATNAKAVVNNVAAEGTDAIASTGTPVTSQAGEFVIKNTSQTLASSNGYGLKLTINGKEISSTNNKFSMGTAGTNIGTIFAGATFDYEMEDGTKITFTAANDSNNLKFTAAVSAAGGTGKALDISKLDIKAELTQVDPTTGGTIKTVDSALALDTTKTKNYQDIYAGDKAVNTVTFSPDKIAVGDTITIDDKTYQIVDSSATADPTDTNNPPATLPANGSALANGNTAIHWNGQTGDSNDFIKNFNAAVVADAPTNVTVTQVGSSNQYTIEANAVGKAGNDQVKAFYVPAAGEKADDTGSSTKTTIEFDTAKMKDGDKFTFTVDGKEASWTYSTADLQAAYKAAQEADPKADPTMANLMANAVKDALVAAGVDADALTAKGNALIVTNKEVGATKLEWDEAGDTSNAIRIQVGALENEQLAISIDSMNTAGLGLDSSNLDTQESAGRAITSVRAAINKVSDQRATLGAMQNRLDHKIANLKVSSENLSAAESRIRDVDMASEMSNFTKNNILSQAATAMLAQANALPQNVLSLLG